MRSLLFAVIVLFAWGCNGSGRAPSGSASAPPLAWQGEPPVTIALHALSGEDFVQPVILSSPNSIDGRIFLRERLPLDADLPSRGALYSADGSAEDLAAAAALLERVARDDGKECDPSPGLPAWPPTWRVRFYAADGKVMRDFTVPVRIVRCRARAYVGERPFFTALAELGADHLAPDGGAPAPAPRVAPEVAQSMLLALARGTDDASALTVSLADGRGVLIRFATPDHVRKNRRDPVVVKDASLRALIETALSHPAVVAGMRRSARAYPSRVAHGEFRILRRYEGMQYEVLVFSAYMPKEDAESLAHAMAGALGTHDASAARQLRYVTFRPR